MRDPRLDRLSDVIVNYCARVKPDDLVTIRAEPHSMPAVEAVFQAVLQAGGHPSFNVRSERLREIQLRHGSDRQIQHTCPFDLYAGTTCDVGIVLIQPLNTRWASGIDPARAAMAQSARRPGLTAGLKRMAAGEMRYVLTEIPSQAAAQEAHLSLMEYSDFVYRAGFLHLPDPIAAWRQLHEQQERAIEFLKDKRTLRFCSPSNHGETDVTVDISGQTWINCAGGENFPDGEVFTGPRGVDGIINFTYPAIYRGKEVDGIRLKFQGGRVIDAGATKNEDYLIALLDLDSGSRVAGELGIGTNYHLKTHINNAFFDEKIGGTFHIALGAGYPQTGNANESAIHWDIVTDLRQGGTISADGEIVQRNGRFAFPGWPGE